MNYTSALLAAALVGTAVAPAAAQPQSCAGQRAQSLSGSIESVHGNYFTLRTNSASGYVNVYTQNANVAANGEQVRAGVRASAYGCMTPGDRAFVAERVTLAAPNAPRYTSGDRVLDGRVDEVQNGRILVDSGRGHGDTWVTTNQSGFAPGQLIHATGYFQQGDRAFVASNVRVEQNASLTTSVEGQIREVHPGRVLVQSNRPHGYVWVLTDESGLRPGEAIYATGRFDSSRQFVASNISVEGE